VEKMTELTTEQTLWLALADAERDLADATKRLFELHNEFRKYKLSKGEQPKLNHVK